VFRRGYTGWFWEPDFKGSIPFTQTGCEKTQVDWGLPAKQNFGNGLPQQFDSAFSLKMER
jgi:hypothetical protein